jgi:hypothetical protein
MMVESAHPGRAGCTGRSHKPIRSGSIPGSGPNQHEKPATGAAGSLRPPRSFPLFLLAAGLLCGAALLPLPALAADPPESAGAALWATQEGKVDRGVAYPLARWRSLVQEDRLLALEALVGVEGAGLGISREFYAAAGEEGRRRSLAFGLGAVAGYEASDGDALRVIVYGVLRVGRKTGEK